MDEVGFGLIQTRLTALKQQLVSILQRMEKPAPSRGVGKGRHR
jgi:hypothetical protein